MSLRRERLWRRYVRFWSSNPRQDVAEEVQFHLETEIDELVARGLPPTEAREQALAQFGDVKQVMTECVAADERRMRRYRVIQLLETIRDEARYIVMGFARRPWFTAAVVGTLALGVGANAAVFSIGDRVFLRSPAGVDQPSHLRRLYLVRGGSGGDARRQFGLPQARAIGAQLASTFPTLIYMEGRAPVELSPGDARMVSTGWVTPNFLQVLGVRVAAGRAFHDADLRFGTTPTSVIISWRFWEREFAADQSAIGRVIRVRGQPMSIVGITPRGFHGIDVAATDIWVPLTGWRTAIRGAHGFWWEDRGMSAWQLVARLPTGTSEQQLTTRARETLRAELRDYLALNPGSRMARDTAALVLPASIVAARGPGQRSHEMSIAVLLSGVAALVLLIAVANVGNLLLGRAIQRKRELAVRLALGISRARLAGQLVLESLLVGLVASFAASVAAIWIGGGLRSLLFPAIDWAGGPVDLRITLFAALIGVGGSIMAGVIPAFESTRMGLITLRTNVRGGGAQHSRVRATLVVIQAALSLVLLVGTGLFAASLRNIREIDLGYDVEHLVTISAPDSIAEARLPDLAAFARSLPAVKSVALTGITPFEGRYGAMPGTLFTEAGDTLHALGSQGAYMVVEPAYLATVGTRVVRGRDLAESDRFGSQPVMVVSEEMAERIWPRQDPLGQCLRWPKRDAACYRVVGIAENAHGFSLLEDPSAVFYVTLEQSADRTPSGKVETGGVVVRVTGDPAPVVRQLRAELRGRTTVDVDRYVTSMADVLEPYYRPWQLGSRLFFGFAALALILAMLGLYSVLAYVVTLRRHEMAMRLALGSSRVRLVSLVLGDGLRHVALGVGVGALIVIAAAPVVRSLLYHVSPRDPLVLFAAVLVILVGACSAAFFPARRAARVEPMTALRQD